MDFSRNDRILRPTPGIYANSRIDTWPLWRPSIRHRFGRVLVAEVVEGEPAAIRDLHRAGNRRHLRSDIQYAIRSGSGRGGNSNDWQTILAVNEVMTTIAAAAEQQGAATEEIARNVQQASTGTAEVAARIGKVTEAAGGTGSEAEQVHAAAGVLAHRAEDLRIRVDAFTRQIRST